MPVIPADKLLSIWINQEGLSREIYNKITVKGSCIVYDGCKDKAVPCVTGGRFTTTVKRIAWVLKTGIWPEKGYYVRNTSDCKCKGFCVNPEHLEVVDASTKVIRNATKRHDRIK